MGRLMFEYKTQRHRWLAILLVVLGMHLVLGYAWFRSETPRAAVQTNQSDLSIHVNANTATEQIQAEQGNESVKPIPHTDATPQTDNGLRADASHTPLDAPNRSNNSFPKSPADDAANGRLTVPNAQTALEQGVNGNARSAVDCMATHKAVGAPAGMTVKVWVERIADGRAVFRGLVNQQGEASHYLAEVKQAVQDIQFIAHDSQCVGIKTMLTVRIVQ